MNDNQAVALRPALPADAPLLADLMRESIADLTAEDYSEGQQAAWMAVTDDKSAFAARLAGNLTLVGTLSGEIAGFASLAENTVVDLLFVRPEMARQGVATQLCEALERLAGARGAKQLSVNASDTAEPFFAGRGYQPVRRETVTLGGEWLGRTVMEKALIPSDTARHP